MGSLSASGAVFSSAAQCFSGDGWESLQISSGRVQVPSSVRAAGASAVAFRCNNPASASLLRERRLPGRVVDQPVFRCLLAKAMWSRERNVFLIVGVHVVDCEGTASSLCSILWGRWDIGEGRVGSWLASLAASRPPHPASAAQRGMAPFARATLFSKMFLTRRFCFVGLVCGSQSWSPRSDILSDSGPSLCSFAVAGLAWVDFVLARRTLFRMCLIGWFFRILRCRAQFLLFNGSLFSSPPAYPCVHHCRPSLACSPRGKHCPPALQWSRPPTRPPNLPPVCAVAYPRGCFPALLFPIAFFRPPCQIHPRPCRPLVLQFPRAFFLAPIVLTFASSACSSATADNIAQMPSLAPPRRPAILVLASILIPAPGACVLSPLSLSWQAPRASAPPRV